MFYLSYQNGGKILGMQSLPEGFDDSEINGEFIKTNNWMN